MSKRTPEQELPPLAPPSAESGLAGVWKRRYLLGMIVHNTMQSRYQGTALGWAWSYLQPLVRFFMFYFVFQVFMARQADTTPNFAIHLFAAMVLVHFFSEAFNGGTQSLVSNRSLITKLAMPKELFPVSRVLLGLWHTGPMLVILVIACLLVGWQPDSVGLAAGVLGFLLIATLGTALALMFSVANVYLRDFGKIVQTLNQFVTFSVPMMYPFSMVADRFHGKEWAVQLYMLNPVTEAVLLMQRCFWVGTVEDQDALIRDHMPADLWERGFIMLGVCLALLWASQRLFTRLERGIAERL